MELYPVSLQVALDLILPSVESTLIRFSKALQLLLNFKHINSPTDCFSLNVCSASDLAPFQVAGWISGMVSLTLQDGSNAWDQWAQFIMGLAHRQNSACGPRPVYAGSGLLPQPWLHVYQIGPTTPALILHRAVWVCYPSPSPNPICSAHDGLSQIHPRPGPAHLELGHCTAPSPSCVRLGPGPGPTG